MKSAHNVFLIALALLVSACGRETNPQAEAVLRLPLVHAPLDTMQSVAAAPEADSGVVESTSDVDLAEPAWLSARLDGMPPPKDLTYIRHENPQYGYAFMYPDTLFDPVQSIGEGRGIELATSDGRSRLLVYAIEDAGREDLDSQYRAVISESEGRVTYRARDESWYIVTGTYRDTFVYEKALLSGRTLKTIRISYPVSASPYFDAVTAVIASSFH